MCAGSPKPIVSAILLVDILVAAGTLGCTESLPPVTTAGSKSPVKAISPTAAEPQLSDTQLAEEFTVTEPSPSNPVVAAMKFNPPTATPGGASELLIYVRIARAHYVHASSEAKLSFLPLKVSMQLPKELQGQGSWHYPQPESESGGESVYRNALLLRLPIKVASDVPASTLEVNGELSFQVCTDELCWPLQSVDVSAPLIIQSAKGSP